MKFKITLTNIFIIVYIFFGTALADSKISVGKKQKLEVFFVQTAHSD